MGIVQVQWFHPHPNPLPRIQYGAGSEGEGDVGWYSWLSVHLPTLVRSEGEGDFGLLVDLITRE